MDSILIVSKSKKFVVTILELLSKHSFKEVSHVECCEAAEQVLRQRDYDLCIINAPLPDKYGGDLARSIISKGICQVIMISDEKTFEDASSRNESYGIYIIKKPIDRKIFTTVLHHCFVAYNKMKAINRKNFDLEAQICDLKIVDRAKCILVETMHFSEKQAHKYIEKQAMDMRITRRKVAEEILKTYDN